MSSQLSEAGGVRLAIEGCGHGTLHAIYASVAEACTRKCWPGVDLLIIGGDFQAVRNAYDLNCVSMPAKYRSMCDFHEYYSGQRTAPYLTIFVGGNHEASNYLFELSYGGWVAPNIYYMGAANVVRIGPLRVAAMSGIWKGYNYRKPHNERLPYNESDMKSIYHVRELDVRKLLQIRTQVDIGVSHDWPKGVEWKGNWKQLFRFKKHFEEDARSGQLGSVAAQLVLDWLRPRWWFSAHLHCKYAAVVDHAKKEATQQSLTSSTMESAIPAKHEDAIDLEGDEESVLVDASKNADEIDLDLDGDSGSTPVQSNGNVSMSANADEIDLELEDDADGLAPVTPGQGLDGVEVPLSKESGIQAPTLSTDDARAALPDSFRRPAAPEPAVHPPGIANPSTHFLALDKCLPGRHFLQLMDVPSEVDVESMRPLKLEYDREWLAITRAFALNEPVALGDPYATVPRAKSQAEYKDLIDKQTSWIDDHSGAELVVPLNFEPVAPAYDGGNWNLPQYSQVMEFPNPQTAQFCKMLQIPNPFEISEEAREQRLAEGPRIDPGAERFSSGPGQGGFRHGRGRGHGRRRGGGGGGRGLSRGR